MASQKLLSVVVPYYNTDKDYCQQCLESLSALPREAVEVIVVDDGSRLGMWESFLSLLGGFDIDARTFSKENGGQNSARQLGLDEARGEYVLFCDSDDFVDPRALWETATRAHESGTPILAFGFDRVRPDGSVMETCCPWPAGFEQGDVGRLVLASDSLCRQVYRVETLRSLPFGLVQGIRIGEDLASSMSILLKVGEAETYGDVVYHYVQRNDSVLHKVPEGSLMDICKAFDEVLARCPDEAEQHHDEVEWMAILHVLYWNSVRIVQNVGLNKDLKCKLFDWMKDRFPTWRDNALMPTASKRVKPSHTFSMLTSGHWRKYKTYIDIRHLAKCLVLGLRPSLKKSDW